MKRVFILLTSIVVLNGSLIAQDRVNRTQSSFTSSSTELTRATGWSYNESTGKWIENQNMISNIVEDGSLGSKSIHMDFKKMVFKTFIHNSQTYYLLIVDDVDGGYKYPALKMDWFVIQRCRGYVFDSVEFEKIKNYQTAKSCYTVYCSKVNDDDVIIHSAKDGIDTYLSSLEKYGYSIATSTSETFSIKKTDDGVSVRFRAPEFVSQYFTPSDEKFETNYFEIPLTSFSEWVEF